MLVYQRVLYTFFLKYDWVKDSSCVCQIGFQSAKILNRLRHVLKAEEGEQKRKRSQKISEIHSFTASPFAFCSHPEVCCKDLDYSGDTDARSEKWEVVYPADHPVIRPPVASCGMNRAVNPREEDVLESNIEGPLKIDCENL